MTLYTFGGIPDAFVEDRESGDRMPGVTLTILDAVSLAAVTGLLDGEGAPTPSVVTDAYGYWAFSCESPTVVIEVTDTLGTAQWGPIASPGAIRDTVVAIPDLAADVAAATTAADAATTAANAATTAANAATTALDAKIDPDQVLAGANVTVDRVTIPGSVVINAAGGSGGGSSSWLGGNVVVPTDYPGLDRTGATGSGAAIAAIAAAAADGDTIWMPPPLPGARYKIDSRTTVTDKSLRWMLGDATFEITSTSTGAGRFLQTSATFGTTVNVSACSVILYADLGNNAEDVYVTRLTCSSDPAAAGIVVGDLVKVFSDDTVPWASGTVRNGQTFQVFEVTGSYVYLRGEPVLAFSTNVRVARYKTDAAGRPYRFAVVGGTFIESTANQVAGVNRGSVIQTNGMAYPEFRDLTFKRISGPAIEPRRGYQARIRDLTLIDLLDTPGVFGYGVNDSSQGTSIVGLRSVGGRHAYTTGSPTASAGATDARSYGFTTDALVTDYHIEGHTQAGLDTHGDAHGVVFDGGIIVGCYIGVKFRGVRCALRNTTIRGGGNGTGVIVDTTSSADDSYGSVINGVRFQGIRGNAVVASSTSGTETRPLRVANIEMVDQDTAFNVLRADAALVEYAAGTILLESATNATATVNGGTVRAITTVL